jgi:hypothetical protein
MGYLRNFDQKQKSISPPIGALSFHRLLDGGGDLVRAI